MEEQNIFKNKTWKEELSIAMSFYLMYLGYVGATGPLEILVWPFMFFITAAFGMGEFSKFSSKLPTRGSGSVEK